MYLGLDLGTTNVKALVTDAPSQPGTPGRIIADGSASVVRRTTPDGGVEQDIEQIWRATLDALAQATRACDGREIRAIGVSSQGGALQLLDADHRPLGQVISWLDARGRPYDQAFEQDPGIEYLIEHTGGNVSTMTIGQLLRLADTQPRTLARAAEVAFVGDLIVERLCGTRAHDRTSLSIGMLYNPAADRSERDLLERLSIADKCLGELLPADASAGGLLPNVAEATGLRAGIPVSPAVHDQYAASLGTGAVRPGDVMLGTGTAWVLLVHTDRLTRPVLPRTFVAPHPVAGIFGQMISTGSGGSALDWAMRLCGRQSCGIAELDAELDRAGPGSDGVICWPLMLPAAAVGVAGTELTAGGRLDGIRLGHGPEHVCRAVIEGLCCELGRYVQMLVEAGLPVRRLVVSGPGATSRVTPQVIADVTDRPVSCVSESSVGALGATILARRLAENDATLADLAQRHAPTRVDLQPSDQREFYAHLLQRYLEPFG
jgi:sugar (pentulose or hexulose) kinase